MPAKLLAALLVLPLLACGGGECDVAGAGCGEVEPGNLHIELRVVTNSSSVAPTAGQLQLFDQVKRRLESIITRKLGRNSVLLGKGECGSGSPTLHENVDDLLVLLFVEPIDGYSGIGSGGVLAGGAACVVRHQSNLPVVSYVRLDAADIGPLQIAGKLESVFLHELLHSLGFGNVWGQQFANLLKNPSRPNHPGSDTYFSGQNAVEAFDQIGGVDYQGIKVPVENTGDAQADTHWRGSVLVGELMEPYLLTGPRPVLSLITLRSLQDLGYSVDLAKAESYLVQIRAPAASELQAEATRFDVPSQVPVRLVDRAGRVLRVERR